MNTLPLKYLCLGTLLSLSARLWSQETAPLLADYCLDCHNIEDWAGSLALDTLNYEQVAADAAVWEKVVRKLRAGMMPPAGEPRPSEAVLQVFVSSLENRLDRQLVTPPEAPALHRLNRAEYANVIRDLLALEVDIVSLLPQDNASDGFDNVASGLGFSPALVQGYSSTAVKVSLQAVGDLSATEQAEIYLNAPELQQDRHFEGMPLGTRGGMAISHHFPLDATYEVVIRGGIGFARNPDQTSVYVTLDGERLEIDNPQRFTLALSAGQHELTVSLLDHKHPTGVNDIYSEYELDGSITGIEIHGPYQASGRGDTASRRAIFSCYPASNDEELACARRILSTLATRAFREPIADDALAPLMRFYTRGYGEGGFETGIQQGLARILMDPRFLFRFEEEPAGLAPGEQYLISDLELASRLSFFLWSSIPDEHLMSLAVGGQLQDAATLRAEVVRMLADPRAAALVENFAGQWLHLRALAGLTPETEAFNDNLRRAIIRETQLLFAHLIEADRPVTELLNASYTFLNETLAQHYGINEVYGDYFRRVALPSDSVRRGLLGHASFLSVTSTASRTSPVLRGNWVLENLLHAPVPAPPPGVETNLDGDGSEELTRSVRERLERHRVDPACAACHDVIDPVGFALENFDMIGAWRERDGDSLIDAAGVLVDGTPVAGPADLRRALLERQDLFVSTMSEKLLTYGLGRALEYYDMPTVRAIVREAKTQDYRFSALVSAIVTSEAFRSRTASGTESGALAGP